MGDIKAKFGTSNQTIVCTLTSLGNGSARESTVVDNSTNLFMDALVTVKLKAGSSGVSTSGYVNIYAYGTVDGGTAYSEALTGSDAAATLTSPTQLRLVGVIHVVANNGSYRAGPFSVAQAFGGVLPEKWGLVVENKSGAALSSTGSDHELRYQGVYATY